jgi:hypothetical protein
MTLNEQWDTPSENSSKYQKQYYDWKADRIVFDFDEFSDRLLHGYSLKWRHLSEILTTSDSTPDLLKTLKHNGIDEEFYFRTRFGCIPSCTMKLQLTKQTLFWKQLYQVKNTACIHERAKTSWILTNISSKVALHKIDRYFLIALISKHKDTNAHHTSSH